MVVYLADSVFGHRTCYFASEFMLNQAQAVANAGDMSNSVSDRKPSATIAFLLMAQLQFLATLSLVEYDVTEKSWLADFSSGLR